MLKSLGNGREVGDRGDSREWGIGGLVVFIQFKNGKFSTLPHIHQIKSYQDSEINNNFSDSV